eukprot:1378204-Alexandrium_andersonii.AAC.1
MQQNAATSSARSKFTPAGPAPGMPPAGAQTVAERTDRRSEVLFAPHGPCAHQGPPGGAECHTTRRPTQR